MTLIDPVLFDILLPCFLRIFLNILYKLERRLDSNVIIFYWMHKLYKKSKQLKTVLSRSKSKAELPIPSDYVISERLGQSLAVIPTQHNVHTHFNNRDRQMIVLIGNVGVGARQIANELSQYIQKPFILDGPLDSEAGEKILDLYYKDPKNTALATEIYVLTTRFRILKEALKECDEETILISCGHIFSDRMAFEATLVDMGYITRTQDLIYEEMYHQTVKDLEYYHPDSMFIYLKLPVEQCMKRIKNLEKEEEDTGVTEEYLKHIEKQLECLVLKLESERKQVVAVEVSSQLDNTMDTILASIDSSNDKFFENAMKPSSRF